MLFQLMFCFNGCKNLNSKQTTFFIFMFVVL